MFIAGALVVGGAIVAHDNHSDYSDYSRHSQYHQYSDAYLVSEIKAKEAELERKKLESERIKEELRIRYFESLQKLKSEEGLENIVEKVENYNYNKKDKKLVDEKVFTFNIGTVSLEDVNISEKALKEYSSNTNN